MLRLFQKTVKENSKCLSSTRNIHFFCSLVDGSTTIDQLTSSSSNQLEDNESSNSKKICSGLTNDEQLNKSSSMESTDILPIKVKEKIVRREKKMQERWTMSTKIEHQTNEHLTKNNYLGVEFPPIAVLRRKFSSLPASPSSPPSQPPPPPILNPPLTKRKDISSSSITSKTLLNQIESKNPSKSNDQISSTIFKSSMSSRQEQVSQ